MINEDEEDEKESDQYRILYLKPIKGVVKTDCFIPLIRFPLQVEEPKYPLRQNMLLA